MFLVFCCDHFVPVLSVSFGVFFFLALVFRLNIRNLKDMTRVIKTVKMFSDSFGRRRIKSWHGLCLQITDLYVLKSSDRSQRSSTLFFTPTADVFSIVVTCVWTSHWVRERVFILFTQVRICFFVLLMPFSFSFILFFFFFLTNNFIETKKRTRISFSFTVQTQQQQQLEQQHWNSPSHAGSRSAEHWVTE